MNKFYVYLHIRKTDGRIFYVGKGCGNRATSKRHRSDWWWKTVRKHGYDVEIAQKEITEKDAFFLEEWLIAKFRHEDHPLVNLTDGGDGISGYKFTDEQVDDKKIPVICSSGMRFDSSLDAEMWIKKQGWPKASRSAICNCCKGNINTAYGYSWWYQGDNERKFINRGGRSGRSVKCSNGMEFKTMSEAGRWLRNQGFPRANKNGIYNACSGKFKKYRGYEWSYVNEIS